MTVEREEQEYAAKTGRSRVLYEEALAVMPGGNSRTTTFFDPYPFYIQRGQGAHVEDADGNVRLDLNGNYTSLILGHAPPEVVKAAQEAAAHGLSFPGPTEHEIRLAELLTQRIPSVERVRFTNSGTEATMNAVRLARAFTGRPKIAKFEGAFHGTHDWVMVSVTPDPKAAGGRQRPKPIPWSAGLPPAVAKHVVVLPWNDAEADEVISFRVAPGGAQERFGARPDLTTLGKIIGGGLPVGAFGGRRDIMDFYDPRRGGARISQGGTFNANPVTMAAGVATMNALTPDAYARLDALGERLRGGVTRLLEATRRKGHVTGVGSLFCLHWTTAPITDYRSTRPKDPDAPMRVFLGLLNEGILLTQRGMGAISLAMTEEDIDRFVNALARVLARG
ncbi:MAG: aspartate aminotransferase family protein [Candidatus Rokubacteria bacterium]|nr:aspartate aminotransferase family protein [Candidatus Rokubacteria bacterium]